MTRLDISDWDTKPVPPREWSVQDRVPLRQVSLFSGEGAMGKTLLELQRVVAHVTGQFWLGMEVAQGPAMYIGAEDEADEIQRRVVDIARHYGAKFSAMKGNLHLLSLAGEDAVLAAPNKNRVLQPTPLFWRIKEAACDIRPKLIVLCLCGHDRFELGHVANRGCDRLQARASMFGAAVNYLLLNRSLIMGRKNSKRRKWTRIDIRELKTLARQKMPAAKIARRLKRTEGATRQKAFSLGVSLDSRV